MVHFPGRAQNLQRDAFAARQFGQRLHVRLGEQSAHSGSGLQATRRDFLVEAERQRKADRIGIHVLAQLREFIDERNLGGDKCGG